VSDNHKLAYRLESQFCCCFRYCACKNANKMVCRYSTCARKLTGGQLF